MMNAKFAENREVSMVLATYWGRKLQSLSCEYVLSQHFHGRPCKLGSII